MAFSDLLCHMARSPALAVTVLLTLAVLVVNGWTDAPNAIAGVVVSGALPFPAAAALAALCNCAGVQPVTEISSVEEAFDEAYARKGDGILFCVGSLYLVGSLKEILRSRKNA